MMKIINIGLEPKKFVGHLIRVCLNCGSEKISSNKFTILCKACGALNFYEGVAL